MKIKEKRRLTSVRKKKYRSMEVIQSLFVQSQMLTKSFDNLERRVIHKPMMPVSQSSSAISAPPLLIFA